jgi:hypothetical protein
MFLITIFILIIFYFIPLYISPIYAVNDEINHHNKSNQVPIIFVFTVSNVSCKWGFPDYIKISLGIYIYYIYILIYLISNIYIYIIRTSIIYSTKFTYNISVEL